MNTKCLFLAAAATAMGGCAGLNTTMFTTKSNVGLDIDTKTPTAEITVARKESVFEPSFENGQTPPVMASFKPHVGYGGGFQNFFVGVDQTFAGGDAAVIMSKLYDASDAQFDPATENSALVLSAPPKYKSVFRRVPGPGESRPFIFATDTILGLKVVWSGTSGQLPDSIKAGFNRKEFAWAPLTMSQQIVGGKTNTLVSMPPFLATIESQIKGSGGTNSIDALQYFATGEAARQLSLKRDVRKAMLARLDPNAANQKARFGKLLDQPGDVGVQAQIVLSHVYDGLVQLAGKGDTEAQTHVESLDKLGNLAQAFTSFGNTAGTLTASPIAAPTTIDFGAYATYQSNLHGSVNELTAFLSKATFQYQPLGGGGVKTVTPGTPDAQALAITLGQQQQMATDLANALRNNAAAAAAIKYYCQQLSN